MNFLMNNLLGLERMKLLKTANIDDSDDEDSPPDMNAFLRVML